MQQVRIFLVIMSAMGVFFLSGADAVSAAVQLVCSDGSAAPGNYDTVAINVTGATGLSSFYLTLNYDTASLDAEQVSLGALASGFTWESGYPAIDEGLGQIRLAASGTALATDSGALVEVLLGVAPAASGSSVLSLSVENLVVDGGSVGGDTVDGIFSTSAVPCQGAAAEVSPVDVVLNIQGQSFDYFITPAIGSSDAGVNQVEITVPTGYTNVSLTSLTRGDSVLTGGGVDYSAAVSGNSITLTLIGANLVSTDQTLLKVGFTADTPTSEGSANFTASLDNTAVSDPVACVYGDGDNGGSVTTNTWTVVARYAGPCASASAEITPTFVDLNVVDQVFEYYISPVIGAGDSGIDMIQINVPTGYGALSVTSVSVGGSVLVNGVDYSVLEIIDNVMTIILTASQKVTVSGTLVKVVFVATTPNSMGTGYFSSSVDDNSYNDPVTCVAGDGDAGAVSTDSWTVNAGGMEIVLQSGWNLISLPLEPADTSVEVVLAGISGNYASVWAFDPSTYWSSYFPGQTGNSLVSMESGKGYWINMTAADSLYVGGSAPSSTVSLAAGWNLVGYGGDDGTAVDSSLSGVTFSSVWAFDAVSYWSSYFSGGTGNSLTSLTRGAGYWVYAVNAGSWSQ